MVKFQVMEIFPENMEVLENLPANGNFPRIMANMVQFNELYQVTAVKWSKRSLAARMA
jgi:preprotein translocase subunit SecB